MVVVMWRTELIVIRSTLYYKMAQVKCKIHKEKSSDVYPDPDFYPSDLGSWISHPGSNNSNKRDKNITKQNQIKPI